jgi:hypothetical protein
LKGSTDALRGYAREARGVILIIFIFIFINSA